MTKSLDTLIPHLPGVTSQVCWYALPQTYANTYICANAHNIGDADGLERRLVWQRPQRIVWTMAWNGTVQLPASLV